MEGATTPAQINFVAPTLTRIGTGLCRDAERTEDGTATTYGASFPNDGILVGQVSDSAGAALAGAMVRVLLRSFDISRLSRPSSAGNAIEFAYGGAVFPTDRNGYYRACWIPVDTDLRVSVVESSIRRSNWIRYKGESLWNLTELHGETVVIVPEVPVRTLDLRVESN